MRNLKIIMMHFILTFVLTMRLGVGLSYDKSGGDFNALEFPAEAPEPTFFIEPVDCFEYAESVTGFSAEALRGIAATESHFKVNAVGDGGMSLGMFQLHSRWHESRVEKWGEFDPIDPFESAVIAGRIMQENLIAFNGDLRMAISAYKQGVKGVNENGVIDWYVDAVLNWRNDSKKSRLFLSSTELRTLRRCKMGIKVQGRKVHINLTIPLPYKYRGGGVAVFRINSGRPEVLLGLRAGNPGRGTWSFPGGEAKVREKLSTAAVREFQEETGVQLYGRHITKTGLFKIKSFFFEWNTLIIESVQYISLNKGFKKGCQKGGGLIGGEFASLQWAPLSEIDNYKLHWGVKDAVNFYLSGKMKPYTAKPQKAVKVDHDGAKYYQPKRQTDGSKRAAAQEVLYGV
jgi:8-oxo-dGTP pyrophosphatase MutT (NUDIX family)